MFPISRSGISQPAIHTFKKRKRTYWPHLRTKISFFNYFAADINLVEVMCPLFRTDVWILVQKFLDSNRATDWGPNDFWCKIVYVLMVNPDQKFVCSRPFSFELS